jgi:hypothetical protein
VPSPADDLPHGAPADAGPGSEWAESWWFDFAAGDGALGGFLRLTIRRASGTSQLVAALVGDGRRYLLVRDDDLRSPSGATPEVRGEGLWAALECETPLEHWTVGLEAFAVALDDPFTAWGDERGDRVGLGFDLEWETAASVPDDETGDGFWVPCIVSGEVLVGAGERLEVEASGWRSRHWGARLEPRPWMAGRLGDRWLGPSDHESSVTIGHCHVAPLMDAGTRVLHELCALTDADGRRGAGWRSTPS